MWNDTPEDLDTVWTAFKALHRLGHVRLGVAAPQAAKAIREGWIRLHQAFVPAEKVVTARMLASAEDFRAGLTRIGVELVWRESGDRIEPDDLPALLAAYARDP